MIWFFIIWLYIVGMFSTLGALSIFEHRATSLSSAVIVVFWPITVPVGIWMELRP